MDTKTITLTHNQYQVLLALTSCVGFDCVADILVEACNECLGFDNDSVTEEEIELALDLENSLFEAIGNAI